MKYREIIRSVIHAGKTYPRNPMNFDAKSGKKRSTKVDSNDAHVDHNTCAT